jgi:hypothetical protein
MFCIKCGNQLPEESPFCSKCGTAQALRKKSGSKTLYVLLALLALVVLALVWPQLNKMNTSPGILASARGLVPASTKLLTGETVVKAGGYVTNTFTVEPGMQNFRIAGHFKASGGSGNDIQVVIATEDDFDNWINGHQAKVFYGTEQITDGNLNVGPLAPGKYVLAFSNKFSLLTTKYVSAEIEATWLR